MATGNQKGTGIGHLLSRILITLVLIGVLCGCFCGIAFAMYVHIYINPSAQETAVEISKGLGLNLNSFIYAKESDSDEYTLYETIKGKENREWVDSDKIPDTLKNAVVAIEDERFYKHHGVDWVRTIGAVKGWLLGGTQYGGSTITQQLIKNITADNDYSVKRKVNEIFRAFALEKEIDDKDRILGHVPEHDLPGLQQLRRADCGDAATLTRMYRSWIWQNPPCWQVSPTTRRFTTFITIPKR